LSDALDHGVRATATSPLDGAVGVPLDTTAAFVGRALQGPLDTPVLLSSFAGFQRRFGGIWQRSSLGPAVQQFFDHGGRQLYVVRIANNARGAKIRLPVAGDVLVLRAVEPGSVQNIRTAVDYDGIGNDEQRFNLTVQRVAPDTGLVADQEIYQQLTCRHGEHGFIGDELLSSSLIRVQMPAPGGRPARTDDNYAAEVERGTDGHSLSDYDLVGCASRNTGMFALHGIDHFDLLYMPPPARDHDLGPAAVLAAELYCRKRGAMLIMDPPRSWTSVREAIAGVREAGYTSPNTLTYFPRVCIRDEGERLPRVAGGAIAGLLCKLDQNRGPWEDLDQRGYGLNRNLVPMIELSIDDAQMLVKEGINVIAGRTAGRTTICGSVTLARGGQMDGNFSSLTIRRLCLEIINTVDHATRWITRKVKSPEVAEQVDSLIHAYLRSLAAAGAFADDSIVVRCDAGLHSGPVNNDRGIAVLLAFRPAGSDATVSLTLHQTTSGFRVSTTAFAPGSPE